MDYKICTKFGNKVMNIFIQQTPATTHAGARETLFWRKHVVCAERTVFLRNCPHHSVGCHQCETGCWYLQAMEASSSKNWLYGWFFDQRRDSWSRSAQRKLLFSPFLQEQRKSEVRNEKSLLWFQVTQLYSCLLSILILWKKIYKTHTTHFRMLLTAHNTKTKKYVGKQLHPSSVPPAIVSRWGHTHTIQGKQVVSGTHTLYFDPGRGVS